MWWASTEDWTLIERTTLRKNIGWSIQEFCFFLNFNYCTNHFKAKIEWVPNLLLFSQSNINSIVYLRCEKSLWPLLHFRLNLLVKSQWWKRRKWWWGGGGWYCNSHLHLLYFFGRHIFAISPMPSAPSLFSTIHPIIFIIILMAGRQVPERLLHLNDRPAVVLDFGQVREQIQSHKSKEIKIWTDFEYKFKLIWQFCCLVLHLVAPLCCRLVHHQLSSWYHHHGTNDDDDDDNDDDDEADDKDE